MVEDLEQLFTRTATASVARAKMQCGLLGSILRRVSDLNDFATHTPVTRRARLSQDLVVVGLEGLGSWPAAPCSLVACMLSRKRTLADEYRVMFDDYVQAGIPIIW